MLGRAADNLFWMARYVERAENIARLLQVSCESALLPSRGEEKRRQDWEAPLWMTGALDDFHERYEEVTEGRVLSYMILDNHNSSSIRASLWRARENARASRHLLTAELWEGLNHTWLGITGLTWPELRRTGVSEHLEWVRDRSHLFRGALYGSMRRSEGFWFSCLGTSLERADNTARLLRVKWEGLAGDIFSPGQKGGPDFYRATVLLKALSAYKSYREIYATGLDFHKIADLLILRNDMPRSLMASLREGTEILNRLNPGLPASKQASDLLHRLESVQVSDLMRLGLHVFLDDFSRQMGELSQRIQRDFMMVE
ncbi:alpha-E domain-containing protein [Telmatospirillum sp. J64-1]|uniref:alpha-E domain-containing protein n=1 Tax=Telmatospirillum sp. J64-1 TaxID=2502183 RepID=UPI00115E39BE|nr:alpha-E domain-containing protein [Telmatospirillum sp. J64-1]